MTQPQHITFPTWHNLNILVNSKVVPFLV